MKFKAACIQLNNNSNIQQNLQVTQALVKEAAASGARIIFTPENTDLIHNAHTYTDKPQFTQANHPTLKALCLLAKELGIWLNIGSLSIYIEGNDKFFNRSFMVNDQGVIVNIYDKIHLFDSELSADERYKESANFQPGNKTSISDTPFGKVGHAICYDLRFPHLFRNLALQGANYLAVPSAFTKVTGQAHWHVLNRARAIENSCYVMAAAQTGKHNEKRVSYGHSLIIDPWGEVLADGQEEVGFIQAEINPARIEKIRKILPALYHNPAFS